MSIGVLMGGGGVWDNDRRPAASRESARSRVDGLGDVGDCVDRVGESLRLR